MSHPSCLLFSSCIILFLWAFVFSLTAGLNRWMPSEADIQPSDLVVEEGDTIVLNCSFTEKYNGTRNASWLAFRHVGERFGPEYVSVLSDDTAQLRLPNATLHHFGFFVCYMLPNRSLGLGSSSVHVNVVRRPMKPVLRDYRVRNWEWLEFNWSPSKEEQLTYSHSQFVNSEVFWHIQGLESNVCRAFSKEDSYRLPSNGTSRNVWTGDGTCLFQMGQSYCIQVEVTNALKKPVKSDQTCFNTSDMVWPDSPNDGNGSLLDDGKSVVVRWSPPSSTFSYDPLQLTYSLVYKSEWDQVNKSITGLNAVSSYTFTGIPHTNYTAWVRVKTLSSRFWSKETMFRFRTSQRAPYEQPVLNPRGFSISSSDGVTRDVMIYWKAVSKERFNGDGFHYVASVKSSATWETLNNQRTMEAFLEIQLLKPEPTDVRVIAENDVGNCTAPQQPVRIPSFNSGLPTISPVYEVIVELDMENFSFALIHWTYVSEPASMTGITIFWCSSLKPFTEFAHCKPSVEWKELSISERQYNLSSDNGLNLIPEVNRLSLQAGVSIDLNGIPCGIKWSRSLYSLNKVAPPPENVQVVIPDGSDHGYVYVTWMKPECVKHSPCGYADQFLLVYCLVSSVDNEACVDKNYSVRIPPDRKSVV